MTAAVAACPGCAAAPAAVDTALDEGPTGGPLVERLFSLPNIHCAACIRSVEDALGRLDGVAKARVNLTRRIVTVETSRRVTPEQIINAIAAAGQDAAELNADVMERSDEPATRELLIYLALAGFAAMNVMLLSVSVWSGADHATRDFLHWISAAIALPALAIVSRPFYRSAWSALRAGRLNMDVPITLALGLAAISSLLEVMEGGAHAYFDAALSLSFFLLLGRYLETRVRASARSAAAELTALERPTAIVIRSGRRDVVPTADLRRGDQVMIPAGERAPVDGVVLEGRGALDIGVITGESAPVEVGVGDEVAAGAEVISTPLMIEVTAAGADSSLRRTAALVAEAERARGRYVALADRAARIYAPAVHLAALATFTFWVWQGMDMRDAMNIAISVLIITCPCALALAAPAVITAATNRLFKAGVLLKDGSALERLAEVDLVVFDKTGTLTTGAFDVTGASDDALAKAAGLALWSSHPFCVAILAAADARNVTPAKIKDVTETPGLGLEGVFDGLPVRLGSAKWTGADCAQGSSTFLKLGEAAPIQLAMTPRLRPDARDTVDDLRGVGVGVAGLSGDRADAVATTMTDAGIQDWLAEVDPIAKMQSIERNQAGGRRVLMVGDGLNDAGALAGAHVSASPASAINAARAASDIVLMGASLKALSAAVRTARISRRRIIQNFGLAFVYNLIAVPIAVAGLATPLVAALAMSTSSILVVLNAMRVK